MPSTTPVRSHSGLDEQTDDAKASWHELLGEVGTPAGVRTVTGLPALLGPLLTASIAGLAIYWNRRDRGEDLRTDTEVRKREQYQAVLDQLDAAELVLVSAGRPRGMKLGQLPPGWMEQMRALSNRVRVVVQDEYAAVLWDAIEIVLNVDTDENLFGDVLPIAVGALGTARETVVALVRGEVPPEPPLFFHRLHAYLTAMRDDVKGRPSLGPAFDLDIWWRNEHTDNERGWPLRQGLDPGSTAEFFRHWETLSGGGRPPAAAADRSEQQSRGRWRRRHQG